MQPGHVTVVGRGLASHTNQTLQKRILFHESVDPVVDARCLRRPMRLILLLLPVRRLTIDADMVTRSWCASH